MATYQVAGPTLELDGDGGTGNIDLVNTLNPITGGMGLGTVRLLNRGTGLTTVTWTPHNITYPFSDPAYTTDSVAGANAEFKVTSTYFGYTVELIAGGTGFLAGNTITILGTALGGTTTANDLIITVTSVATVGAQVGVITGFTFAGTELWPQSTISTILLAPSSESFINVTGVPANGSYFTCDNSDTGSVYATPVTIVGA